MASARDIKRRIKSVKSTQQITRAMKVVSASKLRKSQSAVLAVRPFARKIEQMMLHLSEAAEHPYLKQKSELKTIGYVVIGSDRGLCGGFNVNLHRFLDKTVAERQAKDFGLVVIGRKAKEYCQRRCYPIDTEYTGVGDNPSFDQARALGKLTTAAYDSGKYDEVWLVYSEFKSAMVQQPKLKRLLPVEQPVLAEDEVNIFALTDYIFEPDKNTVLDAILPQYVDIEVYTALQEAKASEHGARMTAMSSASDNAAEMISCLTLSLNRARQEAITTEINEIVGGAAALE